LKRALPDTITAPRTDPIYNCHAYLTKVPIGAIRPFIEFFTKPGDVVADCFAGSGMTGLAALSVGRNAKLSDISALGQHIAQGYLEDVPAAELRAAGDRVIETARKAIGDLYNTTRESDGTNQEMIRTVWSFVYVCPACSVSFTYYDHLDAKGKAPEDCPSCSAPFTKRLSQRGEDVPVRVVVDGQNGKQVEQAVNDQDAKKISRALKDKRLDKVPSLTIEQHREMYSRSGLGKIGLTETAKFFSPRNAIALLELWTAINDESNARIRRKLRFAFTAILPRASKRYQWSPQRPLNAQNQTYYIAPVYYEWNAFDLYGRKVNAAIKAAEELFGSNELFSDAQNASATYEIASADALKHLSDNSIDYVFTDPPFGSNIFYSDMNLFHEAWLGTVTDHRSEAVVHTTGKRKNGAEERYQHLLRKSFEEAWRVLKPGKHMSVVFGNSSGRIWGLVQRALRDAGFKSTPFHVAILDKGQRSVKGLNSGSEGVVTVDLVLTVQKPLGKERADDARALESGDKEALITEVIGELLPEESGDPSHIYARILRKAIQKHVFLDDLHLGDVLVSLRNAGYTIDRKTGKLSAKKQKQAA
jgi:16S rRNA G966 N2-methylase RsmD